MYAVGNTVVPNTGEVRGRRCKIERVPLSYSQYYKVRPLAGPESQYVYFYSEEHFEPIWYEAEVF